MILTKEVEVTVNYLNIRHYISLGYVDIKCNQKIVVKIKELPMESNIKILVKCDICENEKYLSLQKYNKNIRKYNIYTCNTLCSQVKNKMTLKKIYGSENYNKSEENKLKVKEKYDIITKEIEKRGFIVCKKCDNRNDLTHYLRNTNNRYKSICRKCRCEQMKNSKKDKDMSDVYKLEYKKNIHIHAWRNLLRNYLKRKNIPKNDRTYILLKYSHLELKEHLESLFTDKMNWDNYGLFWQIDHIIPVSMFKSETPIDIVNCLENLRPLDKLLNNIKKDKIDVVGYKIIDKYKTYLKV